MIDEVDIKNTDALPDIPDVGILFHNAGVQNSMDDIENNLTACVCFVSKTFSTELCSVT